MKIFRYISALILPVFVSTAIASHDVFSDTKGNFAEGAIAVLANNGVISGYKDGTFRPNNPVKRAEMLKMVIEGFDMYHPAQDPAGFDIQSNSGISFKDAAPKSWYNPYLRNAKGIVDGYKDGTFQPGKPVKRAEAVKIIAATARKQKIIPDDEFRNVSEATMKAELPYKDISGWSLPWVYQAYRHDILKNLNFGKMFQPNKAATRAEVAQMIYNAFPLFNIDPTPALMAPHEPPVIKYSDSGYSPATITVKVGTDVVFFNESSGDFWPASAIHPTHEILPEFDSKKAIPKGETYSFTFEKKGTWKYHDHLHPNHWGSVTVE